MSAFQAITSFPDKFSHFLYRILIFEILQSELKKNIRLRGKGKGSGSGRQSPFEFPVTVGVT
jgi:hypothetical protein